MTREPSLWDLQRAENPGHSKWYIERFRALEETGQDLVGEARLIDAMAPRELPQQVERAVAASGAMRRGSMPRGTPSSGSTVTTN